VYLCSVFGLASPSAHLVLQVVVSSAGTSVPLSDSADVGLLLRMQVALCVLTLAVQLGEQERSPKQPEVPLIASDRPATLTNSSIDSRSLPV